MVASTFKVLSVLEREYLPLLIWWSTFVSLWLTKPPLTMQVCGPPCQSVWDRRRWGRLSQISQVTYLLILSLTAPFLKLRNARVVLKVVTLSFPGNFKNQSPGLHPKRCENGEASVWTKETENRKLLITKIFLGTRPNPTQNSHTETWTFFCLLLSICFACKIPTN